MRPFLKMTWVEIKLFVREPVGLFFTFAFPLIILFIFGTIFGNEPSEQLGGLGSVDVSVPGYIGLITGTLGLIGLPIGLATYRDQGILRRFRATPLQPLVILATQVAVNLIMQLVGVFLLFMAARLVYNLRFPDNVASVVLAIVLSGISFFALGFVLASLSPTPRTAQAVGMALFMPMMFLSGAAMPREILPEGIQRVGEFMPLTHVVELIKNLWYGNGWSLTSVAVLAGLFIACLLVSTRTFRWE